MKTLILLIIGTLFGIWFYTHHSNLIPDGVTQNADNTLDGLKDLWPQGKLAPTTSADLVQQNDLPRITPEVDPMLRSHEDSAQSGDTETLQQHHAASNEAKTPREAAMESYTRTIRMIDSNY